MKKIRYKYQHRVFQSTYSVGRKEMKDFFFESGIKLHLDIKNDYYYSYEFAGEECSWFDFIGEEEVEVSTEHVKLPSENKYENGMNWKNVNKSANCRLRKPKAPKKKVDNRPPINPRTGLRDGGV